MEKIPYIVKKRMRLEGIRGRVNLPYGTEVEAVDGMIIHKGAAVCAVIDRMNVIIQAQAMELAQFGALAHEEEIAAVRRQYARAVGEGVGP